MGPYVQSLPRPALLHKNDLAPRGGVHCRWLLASIQPQKQPVTTLSDAYYDNSLRDNERGTMLLYSLWQYIRNMFLDTGKQMCDIVTTLSDNSLRDNERGTMILYSLWQYIRNIFLLYSLWQYIRNMFLDTGRQMCDIGGMI